MAKIKPIWKRADGAIRAGNPAYYLYNCKACVEHCPARITVSQDETDLPKKCLKEE